VLTSKVPVNRKVMKNSDKSKQQSNNDSSLHIFTRSELMRAGAMPRSLTRVEDWARAEAFAKRTSFHYRSSAEPEQRFGSADYLEGEWASREAARHGKLAFPGGIWPGRSEVLPGVKPLRAGSTAKRSLLKTEISLSALVRITGAGRTENGLGMISRLCAR
jgi:hypothetical protein